MSKHFKDLMVITRVSDSSSELIARFTGGESDNGYCVARIFEPGSTPKEVSHALRQLADSIDADEVLNPKVVPSMFRENIRINNRPFSMYMYAILDRKIKIKGLAADMQYIMAITVIRAEVALDYNGETFPIRITKAVMVTGDTPEDTYIDVEHEVA